MRGTNEFCASDKCFSAGDKCVVNARSNFSPSQLHVHVHITSDIQTELSILLLTGTHLRKQVVYSYMYHALIVTSEHAIPTSYIHNSVLCWTK